MTTMRPLGIILCAWSVAACASSPSAASRPAAPVCVVGAFVEAFSDDGHGVMVTLENPRSSAQRYAAGAGTEKFYVHDKGSPTRGLATGATVWLVHNGPGAAWEWNLISPDTAKQRCPAER